MLQCQAVAYIDRVTNMLALKNRGVEMEGSSSQLEARVVRLETHMEHMDSNISRIMADLHDLRTSTEARFDAVDRKFDAVNEKFDQMNDRISMLHVTMIEKLGEINAKFGEIKVWALTVLGGGLGFGILTVVGRALHWI